MVHCIFGTGLVAGCHLRDVSEHETPTCCTVSFTTALDRLEDSDLRTLLWSIGLPNQTGSVVRIVDQIVELLPDLPTRLMLAMQMSECVETPSPTGTTQMLFLAGLIAAGIQPPTVEVSAGR